MTEAGADGAYGAGTVIAGSEKYGWIEMTSDAWPHEAWRGKCFHELGCDVMTVGMGGLRGSWIWRSMACSYRSPLMEASLLNKGMMG